MIQHQDIEAEVGFGGPNGSVLRSGLAFLGVASQHPLHLTVAAAKIIRHADVIILGEGLDEEFLSYPEVANPGARILDEAGEFDLGDLAELVRAGKSIAWLARHDPLLYGPYAGIAARLREFGCPVDFVPTISLTSMAIACTGLHIPGRLTICRDEVIYTEGTICAFTTFDRVEILVDKALRAGWMRSNPVLAVLDYATIEQRSIETTVSKLLKLPTPENETTPVMVVFGEGARRDASLNWFESNALFGWQVIVPRTKGLPGVLERRLEYYGGSAIQVPTLSVEPPRNTAPMERGIQGLVDGRYQWIIFNSVNVVKAVTERLTEFGLDARALSGLRIAAVGEAAVAALAEWGVRADLVPWGEQTGESLAAEFPAFDDLVDPINRVWLPRAEIAVDALAEALHELGWEVEDAIAYRIVRAAPPPQEIREGIKGGRFDAVIFTSATAVRNMVGIAGKPHPAMIVAAIGPATLAACAEHGLRVDVISEEPSHEALVDALAEFASRRRAEQMALGLPLRRPSQRRARRRKQAR